MCNLSPIRHTASFLRTRAMEENSRPDGSTMVSAPLPTTSSVSSGAMNPAGFSSSPIPMANGLYASAVSSRPSRSRGRKWWSMMIGLVRPSPGARVTFRARGEAPSLPNAIMCSHRNAAPAGAPAKCLPSAALLRRGGALLADRDHVLAQKRRPGGGAGHVHPLRVSPAERLGHLGPPDHGAQPELIASGEKPSVHPVQHVQPFLPLAVAPVGNVKRLRVLDAQVPEELLVAATGLAQHRGRGD